MEDPLVVVVGNVVVGVDYPDGTIFMENVEKYPGCEDKVVIELDELDGVREAVDTCMDTYKRLFQ